MSGEKKGKKNKETRRNINSRKKEMLLWGRVPLAREGEDGEERMTGFFRLLLGL